LERLEGVVQAEVSLEEKTATVQYDPSRVTPEQMIAAVNGIGFRASLQEPPADARYQGQGTVVAVDLKKGTVTVDHGEIKGLMPPMVMAFVVDAREALNGLSPGETIRFTLRPRGVTFTIAELAVVQP
jgi:Cu/Ag efflux protein CusF